MSSDILIVDDEADIRELVAGILQDEGYEARTAKNSDEALAAVEARRPHLVFLDIWLQGSRLDGLQILQVLKEQHPTLPVVMISGHGNIETAVSAIKLGAYDFIEKPFKADRLVLVADMPKETQGKILRVLVDQNFQRVGGATRVHVDVRIISSTSRDLPGAIAQGLFREDLFHRLSVVPIRVPSLSERREDIPELVS